MATLVEKWQVARPEQTTLSPREYLTISRVEPQEVTLGISDGRGASAAWPMRPEDPASPAYGWRALAFGMIEMIEAGSSIGLAAGVAPGAAEAVAVAVAEAVAVAVGVADSLAVAIGSTDSVAVALGSAVAVSLAVGSAVAVAVAGGSAVVVTGVSTPAAAV